MLLVSSLTLPESWRLMIPREHHVQPGSLQVNSTAQSAHTKSRERSSLCLYPTLIFFLIFFLLFGTYIDQHTRTALAQESLQLLYNVQSKNFPQLEELIGSCNLLSLHVL